MAFNNNSGSREWHQGNWKCSECGKEITQLPFEPDPARLGRLKCRDCHQKSRGDFRGGRNFR